MYDLCIIGAGQSGLVTCKTFSENKNNSIIVLEKCSTCTGLFSTIKEQEYFKWSTSRAMSGFSDYPMDKSLPVWFTIKDYVNYLESYKKKFDLEKYILFNSTVTKCVQNENEEWIVTFFHDGSEQKLVTKKLIVCTGLNQTPKFPDITKNFTGELLHTEKVYRDMNRKDWEKKFTNKRVLLIGGAESAFDIGHIIVGYTNELYFSSKNYIEWFPQGAENKDNMERIKSMDNKCFNPAIGGTNTPTDTNLFGAEHLLPEPMSELWHRCGRWFLQKVIYNVKCGKCNHQHTKLCDINKTDDDLFKKYVVKRTEFMIDLHDNKANIIYYPDRIEGTTVYTKDGTIENVDIIVCATGFKKVFPFLDEKITNGEFIKKMVPKEATNIAFIGFARPTMGSIAAIAEMQSWWIKEYFSNELNYAIRKPWFRFKDPLNISNDHINTIVIGCYYLKDLAKDLNIEPNMLYLFVSDFELFKKIFTGSCHPMIYRINGHKTYSNAREILLNTFPDFDAEKSNQEKLYFLMFVVFHLCYIFFLAGLSYFVSFLFYLLIRQKYRRIKTGRFFYVSYIAFLLFLFLSYYF